MTGKSCIVIGFSMAAAVLLFGPFTNYPPPAVDMWFPTGYFTNFADLVERFGLAFYQASRLPHLLPGVALYAIFAPKVANFLLNLLGLGISVSALLAIAARQLDRRWALALAFVFCLNTCLLAANIWDYSDGPAIAWFLTGLAVSYRSEGNDRPRRAALLLTGACWVSAALTHLIAVILVVPFAVHILVMPRFTWASSSNRALWLALGGLLALVLLCIVSKLLFGIWFLPGPQLELMFNSVGNPTLFDVDWGAGFGWLHDAYRLAALYGPLLAAAPCLFLRRCRTPEFVATFLVCATGGLLFVAGDLRGMVLLRDQYFAGFMLIFAFVQTIALVRAATSFDVAASDGRRGPWIAAGLAVAIALIFAYAHDLNVATWPVLAASVVALAAAVLGRGAFPRRTPILAAAVVLVLNLSTASDVHVRWIYDDLQGLYTNALKAQSVLTSSGIVRRDRIRFWYDRSDPQDPLFLAINALYMWTYRDLTATLPKMTARERAQLLPAGTTLVHLCTGTCPLEARTLLLRDAGIAGGATYTWRIVPIDGQPFTLAVQKTQPAR